MDGGPNLPGKRNMAGRHKNSKVMKPTQKRRNTPAQQTAPKLPSLIPSSDKDALAILRASISPVSFWQPDYVPPHSAWLEHAPFAFWLIETLRPRFLVELGTHGGLSYFAFCQAVQRLQLETRCYAVDTWKGDEHAGFYGEEVFREVRNHNDQGYSAFSTLIRSTFDEASRHFRKQSIDLLHIDGRHFYDDVKHDFETWRPKLSNRAVVVFHDTNVRERDFGVFALWKELCEGRPHFEFFHGHGLGILGFGSNLPDRIVALFAARANVEASTQIRAAYSRLGSAVTFQVRAEQGRLIAESQLVELNRVLAERDAKLAALDQALAERNSEFTSLQQALAERDAKVAALDQSVAERNSERTALQQALAERDAKVAALDQSVAERNSERTALQKALAERDAKVAVLDQSVAERNTERTALQQALAERDAKLATLDQALAERNSERGALRQALAERDTKVAALDQALAERNSEHSELQQALAERDVKVAALDQVLSKRNSKRGVLQQALAEWNAKFGALDQALEERNSERGALRGRVADVEASLAGRSAEAARLDAELKNARTRATYLQSELENRELVLQLIRASTSWRLTSPIRRVGDASPRFAQLCRRALNSLWGASISRPSARTKSSVNAPSALTVRTSNELHGGEYVPLFKGSPVNKKQAKLICFYLPQFHAIPENNAWWGEGFTEWTNVRTAQPTFKGHYQPRVPGELGFYNLLNPEVQRRQIELAKLYGVEGFCFYFYWFVGKRLLETPIENYLNDRAFDLPFCLCWANENWTRRWDGHDKEILVAQQHSLEDDLAFIQHISRYMIDSRYIHVNGRPLLIVYRPGLLPSPKETAQRWRSWCRDNGIGEIYLAYTQSFERVDPAEYGFDAAIEFPPNTSAAPEITDRFLSLDKGKTFAVHDWQYFVEQSESYRNPTYKLFRGVCPAWDNTARRKQGGSIFVNSTPALYQRWLSNAIRDTRQRYANPDERLIFVNAWNEWGEGTYLEPDARFGYAYLDATRDAIRSAEDQDDESILLVTHDCHPHGAQFLTLAIAKQLKLDGFKVAIIALDGGKLQDDFARVGRTINAKEAGAAGVENFLASLRAEGTRDAITSTVVSGSIVPQLKNLGFRVLSLIHELPGVIRSKRQQANAGFIARLADKVVFPANLVHERFSEIAPVSADRVVIRHQGLLRRNPYKNRNGEAYRIICEKHHLPRDTQIVLSVAYADSRKGPDLFVEIAAQVLRQRPNTTFIWVGGFDPEMEHKAPLRVQELGMQGQVLFIGFDREPMAYYAAASVYALPSREDPFPNVLLESAEVGVPVVAFEGATGAGELIIEQGGRLASYLDTGDFAHQVCELLTGPVRKASNTVPSLQRYTLDLLRHLNGYPRISVIVPNYNYERHITRRLDSIFCQTFPIYEVIVLDDASSDKSVEVIEAYIKRTANNARLIVNERNSGSVFRQWQKGIAYCTGDLLWIAEADDLADSNFLRELAPAFDDTKMALAFSQSKLIDENGKVLADNYLEYTKDISNRWRKSYINDGSREISESLTVKNVIPNVSGVLFRRSTLEKAIAEIGDDLFGYKVAGDWLIYLYVLLQGKLYYDEKPLNLHRRHTDSVTKALDTSNHLREVCQLQEIAQSLSAPTDETRAKAKAYIEHLHEYFGISAKNNGNEVISPATPASKIPYYRPQKEFGDNKNSVLPRKQEILASAESLCADNNNFEQVLTELRKLRLEEFGELLLNMPDEKLPGLSKLLPSMASAEVQRSWTGADGYPLLQQTLDFVRAVENNFMQFTGHNLKDRKILDFGCGYGRIARLMYYFTSPPNLFCVDPWDQSIKLCQESRLPGNFFISDYVPRSLPFRDTEFDLIYCFSVFTHLSMKTCKIVLRLLRRYIADKGMLVITIRPEDIWMTKGAIHPASNRSPQDMIDEHRRNGFAYIPHLREPIDGDITYGDTSMSVDWLTREFPEWKVEATDCSPKDPYQHRVFLSPRR
jgi:glycosyltransferase involved in cell wall biosynthesis/SAM-dependent methyltransferase